MLARLATFTVRRRRAILVTTLLLFLAAAVYGGNVATRLSSGGFDNPSSDSSQAQHLLDTRFHTGSPNLVLLVDAGTATVDAPRVAEAGRALTAKLAGEADVADVASYWSLGGAAPLRSRDAHQALVVARITGTDKQVSERIKQLQPVYARSFEGLSVRVGGIAEVFRQVGTTTEHDLQVAEMIALPITLLLLLFIFRGLVAAVLPLVIGAISIVGTFTVLKVHDRAHQRLDLRAQPHDRARTRAGHRLQPVRRLALPRGAAPRASTPTPPCNRTVRAAGRTVAVQRRSPSPCRCRCCSCSRPPSCARSPTPASPSASSPASARSSCCPRCSAAWATRSTRCAVRRRAPKPAEEGVWHRIATVRDAPPDPGRHRRHRPAARAGQPVPAHRPRPVRRPGAADLGLQPPGQRRPAHAVRQQRDQRPAGRGCIDRRGRHRRGRDGRHRPLRDAPVERRRRRPRRRPHRHLRQRQARCSARARPRSASAAPARPGCRSCPSVEPESAAGEQLVHDLRALPAPVRGQDRRAAPRSWSTPTTPSSHGCRWPLAIIAIDDLRPAVPDVRQRRRADQGARAERAQPDGDVRRDGVDLPGRATCRACSASRRPARSTRPRRS